MSGYFAALMRSSGLPFGGRASVAADIEPGTALVGVEHGRVEPRRGTAPVTAAWPPAGAQTPADDSVGRLPELPVQVDGRDTSTLQQTGPGSHTAPAAKLAAVHAAADRRLVLGVQPPGPVLGQALVHAAMRWVEADGLEARGDARVVASRSQAVPADRDSIGAPGATQTIGERGDALAPRPPGAERGSIATPDVPARDTFAWPPIPVHPARQVAIVPPAPAAPSPRDEIVEISIGAIHVRVDAPSLQALARPPVTPPADTPSLPAVRPVRSGLERRALRRI